MDRRAKVELFEQMRREYEFGVGTIAGVARHFGVHRRLVRQALASAMPPDRAYTKRPSPALDPLKAFVEAILEADRRAPRKQRHTAHRIWVRCGRRNCRCARGQLHGPYWYHFTRDGGRLRKRYVRPEDLEALRGGIDARRQRQAEWSECRALLGEVSRRVSEARRETTRMAAEAKAARAWLRANGIPVPKGPLLCG